WIEMNIKSKFMFALSFLAFSTLALGNELSVKVEPDKYSFSIKKNVHASPGISNDPIKIHFKVTPETESTNFWVMSCSFFENWKADNPMIYIPAWSCKKNIPHKFESGKPFIGDLGVALTGISLGDKIKFHLMFTPYKDESMKQKGETIKSN